MIKVLSVKQIYFWQVAVCQQRFAVIQEQNLIVIFFFDALVQSLGDISQIININLFVITGKIWDKAVGVTVFNYQKFALSAALYR